MVSYNRIIGLPLFILDEGRKSGIIHDVVFDIKRNIVEGFTNIGINKKRSSIKIAEIKLLEDKIVIQNEKSIKSWNKSKDEKERFVCGKEFIKKKVFDYDGNDIGYVYDIFIDIENGSLEAFHITDGLIEDLIEGRKIIPVLSKIELKEEGLFVGRESIEEFVDVKKGFKQIFSID
ncbi:MAG: PRC-barrel domain-containing protein [Ignavibacteriales bacterium]